MLLLLFLNGDVAMTKQLFLLPLLVLLVSLLVQGHFVGIITFFKTQNFLTAFHFLSRSSVFRLSLSRLPSPSRHFSFLAKQVTVIHYYDDDNYRE